MIFVLIGQSSSGKSTIEKKVVELLGIERIISYTTRPMRENENNHVDYHFVDEHTFLEMAEEGKFSEVARYRDWHYGLSLDGLDYKKRDFVAVVTVHGYQELEKCVGKENITAIHIKVDERDRIIRQINRGDEVDEIFRRIMADRKDFENVEELCHYTVENRTLSEAVFDVIKIINKHTSYN